MTGEWPPSSIVQRIKFLAASCCKWMPTGTLPVKLNLRGIVEASRCSDTCAGTPKTMFNTPAGKPASINAVPIATAVAGVSSLGFIMIEQPAAKAPATLRITFVAGKFHATNASAGPTGTFRASCCIPGKRDGMIRP